MTPENEKALARLLADPISEQQFYRIVISFLSTLSDYLAEYTKDAKQAWEEDRAERKRVEQEWRKSQGDDWKEEIK